LRSGGSARKGTKTARDEGEPELTNNYVFVKFMEPAHSRKHPRGFTPSFIADLIGQPDVEVVWIDATRHEAGSMREKTPLGGGVARPEPLTGVIG
jgi:hypothetical protein